MPSPSTCGGGWGGKQPTPSTFRSYARANMYNNDENGECTMDCHLLPSSNIRHSVSMVRQLFDDTSEQGVDDFISLYADASYLFLVVAAQRKVNGNFNGAPWASV